MVVRQYARTVVTDRDRYGPGLRQYNRTFLDLAHHNGFLPRPCRPYRTKTKGRSNAANTDSRLASPRDVSSEQAESEPAMELASVADALAPARGAPMEPRRWSRAGAHWDLAQLGAPDDTRESGEADTAERGSGCIERGGRASAHGALKAGAVLLLRFVFFDQRRWRGRSPEKPGKRRRWQVPSVEQLSQRPR